MLQDSSIDLVPPVTLRGQVMCPYCGVGCHVNVTTQDNTVTEVIGSKSSPTSHGMLCPKGALLAPILSLPGRIVTPLRRDSWRSPQTPTTWDVALSEASTRLRYIIDKHGPDAVALYGSGQLDTESWYVGNKLFKGFIGSNHVDSNSRLCMTSPAAAYRIMLGSDGPPTCFDDIEHADLFLIAGSNMNDTHPVTFQRIKAHCRKTKAKMIVLDPRQTHTAKAADIHVQLQPGSDVMFFNALGKIILERNGADGNFIVYHTNGFAEYEALLRGLNMNEAAAVCGVPLEQIAWVADEIIASKGLLSLYCMGMAQAVTGTAKCQTLTNLHLLTGHIGKPGAGPFSMTGQPNAMGGRELGGLAHLLPGYRLIENAQHRAEVERLWGVPAGRIHPNTGLTAVEIFQGLESGRIKAIWIVCNNALVSLPNLDQARRAISKAELVIAQDCFETETTHHADYVFPAAQWIEHAGTMTNSERRVSRNVQLAQPPGDAKPDWWIFAQMARHLGYTGFDFADNEHIWDEYRLMTQGRPCDQFGMTNERLKQGPLQWPCPSADHLGTPRRYLGQTFATPDGKAVFVAAHHRPPAEVANAEFPLTLTTGRLASQWHTMSRTGKVAKLASQAIEAFIELHPDDGAKFGVGEGDKVLVQSARGETKAAVRLTPKLLPGVAFMPFHWGGMFAPGGEANNLTNNALDPISKEPEYKACAIRVMPIRAAAREPEWVRPGVTEYFDEVVSA